MSALSFTKILNFCSMINPNYVVSFFDGTKTLEEIAKKVGCSKSTVHRKIKEYLNCGGSYVLVKGNCGKITKNDILLILDRKSNGESVSTIAESYGVSDSYIYRLIRRNT